MPPFNPEDYGPTFAPLLSIDRCRSLGPGRPDASIRAGRESWTRPCLPTAGSPIRRWPHLCLSAVWLLDDHLDESHRISQSVSTSSGSYWHGIMHRREPDYGNSGYWFRRVGDHPIFEPPAGRNRHVACNRGQPPSRPPGRRPPRVGPFRLHRPLPIRLPKLYRSTNSLPTDPTAGMRTAIRLLLPPGGGRVSTGENSGDSYSSEVKKDAGRFSARQTTRPLVGPPPAACQSILGGAPRLDSSRSDLVNKAFCCVESAGRLFAEGDFSAVAKRLRVAVVRIAEDRDAL